jgi:lysophospholipase L1-like esterase
VRGRATQLFLGLATALALAGCTSEMSDLADAAPPPIGRYVALGDSFTAGPLVPTTDVADGCFRSDGNYPSLVADRLDVDRLVDVSCSGADTQDLTGRQHTVGAASVRPQLTALTPGTDLVTLGIGGNDFGVFGTLVRSCTRSGRSDDRAPCAQGADLLPRLDRTEERVVEALREIERRAPDARVLLVGYLRLAPEEGRCPQLPFTRADYAYADRVTRALNEALAGAAERTGVEFVDMYAASEGHDICADEPWVNGVQTDRNAALAYHPFAEGMAAVADELVQRLDR